MTSNYILLIIIIINIIMAETRIQTNSSDVANQILKGGGNKMHRYPHNLTIK